jgi:hypothetical protein
LQINPAGKALASEIAGAGIMKQEDGKIRVRPGADELAGFIQKYLWI